MYLYVNGYHVSVKNDKSEILIDFCQNSPTFVTDENGESQCNGINRETVSSIVLRNELAHELVSALSDMLGDEKA